ncbi:MAG: PAN domain-containing protein [Deltaproteobacteria bacterium]|nr:PAN domain-containing protein [Deltaproteobacteria bacterium]
MRAPRGCGLAGKGALLLTLISFALLLPLHSQAGTYGDTYNSCLQDCTGPCCKEKCAYAACIAQTVAKGVGMKEMTDSRAWGEALRPCSSHRERIRQCANEHAAERRRPASPPPPTVSRGMEYNVDRMGQDYQNFDLPKADPRICQEKCAADPKCKAWTYVKPNTIQGPRPRCWLKHSVPPPRESDCCVSGVKRRAPLPPTSNVFRKPMVKRYRLDWCRQWAADCGKGAADAFCRAKGFRNAKAFEQDPDIGGHSPTYVIGTGQICDEGFCDGFKFVECE